MEEYNKDTNCNPRIHIHEGDDTGVTIRIIKTDSGIGCFNYVYGIEMKIIVEFNMNAGASAAHKHDNDVSLD